MPHLYQILSEKVTAWREAGYPCEEYPAIADIFDYQQLQKSSSLRFLRKPQQRALEIYWYLRLVEHTPHIFALYNRFTQYQNDAVKHNEDWSEAEVEFMVYLTGTFIRLLLQLNQTASIDSSKAVG